MVMTAPLMVPVPASRHSFGLRKVAWVKAMVSAGRTVTVTSPEERPPRPSATT